jgi:hypothetical protein
VGEAEGQAGQEEAVNRDETGIASEQLVGEAEEGGRGDPELSEAGEAEGDGGQDQGHRGTQAEEERAAAGKLHMAQPVVYLEERRVPRYVEYENNFKKEELKRSLERQIYIKNRRETLEIDLEQIKQHEKAYIQRIKERLNIHHSNKSQPASRRSHSPEADFSLHRKDAEEMRKLEEKIRRVKKFESKVRLLPVRIDGEKKKEMLILEDKARHQKKYNFLSQKALSDEQIFDNFKDFDINTSPKDIGNQYLHDFKVQNR